MKEIANVFILGDSYSTFEGYIPDGYAAYYKPVPTRDTDVVDVTDTWWYQLISETESNLVRNCSWSGTTICHTGYDGSDTIHNSFIARFDKLVREGFFKENKIDTFFFFGGTNDSWANSPLGEMMWGNMETKDLYNVRPAICYLVDAICKNVSNAKVYCIINTELKPEIADCLKEVSKKYNVTIVELSDIDKKEGHPTCKGMRQIKEQVLLID